MATEQTQVGGGGGNFSGPVYFNNNTDEDRARACCVLFRGEVEKRLNDGKAFDGFVPINYEPMVAEGIPGINYKILVMVGTGAHAHVMLVCWDLGPGAIPTLTGAEWWHPNK